jgi:hypothetical protein
MVIGILQITGILLDRGGVGVGIHLALVFFRTFDITWMPPLRFALVEIVDRLECVVRAACCKIRVRQTDARIGLAGIVRAGIAANAVFIKRNRIACVVLLHHRIGDGFLCVSRQLLVALFHRRVVGEDFFSAIGLIEHSKQVHACTLTNVRGCVGIVGEFPDVGRGFVGFVIGTMRIDRLAARPAHFVGIVVSSQAHLLGRVRQVCSQLFGARRCAQLGEDLDVELARFEVVRPTGQNILSVGECLDAMPGGPLLASHGQQACGVGHGLDR